MISGNALVVGLARDCAQTLAVSMSRMLCFRDSFSDVRFSIVTNDNTDDTGKVLEGFQNADPSITIVTCDGLLANAPKRTPRIAIARNLYLTDLRRRLALGEKYDYLVVMDLDGVNIHLVDEPDFSQIINNAPADWAGLFANQRDQYYDIWALRHNEWCPDDCWHHVWAAVANRRRHFFRKISRKQALREAMTKFIKPKQRHLAAYGDPIEVSSAFGGFGIYRVAEIGNAFYTGLVDGRETCEHVSFNNSIIENGGKLYILPALLNDSPSEHIA